MIHRKFGTSGIDVSAVGIGTWAFGGWAWPGTDETKAIDAIHAALDRGINLLDTAPTYGSGRSEELVGRAIRGCSREKIVLATKCGLVYDNQTYDRQESELFCQYEADGVTMRPRRRFTIAYGPTPSARNWSAASSGLGLPTSTFTRRTGKRRPRLLPTLWQRR